MGLGYVYGEPRGYWIYFGPLLDGVSHTIRSHSTMLRFLLRFHYYHGAPTPGPTRQEQGDCVRSNKQNLLLQCHSLSRSFVIQWLFKSRAIFCYILFIIINTGLNDGSTNFDSEWFCKKRGGRED